MTEIQKTVSKIAEISPDRIERLWWFLHVLARSGGEADASDNPRGWINAFCADFEDDTFNRAADLGLTRVSHDSDFDVSFVRITEAGRALVAYFKDQPAMTLLARNAQLERRVARLEKVIRPFGNARLNPNWHGSLSIGSVASLSGLKIKHLVALRRALNARGGKG